MADGLGDVALASAEGPGDQHGHLFFNKATRDQFMDEGGVDIGVEVEVELIEGFVGTEGSPAQVGGKAFLVPSCDLIGNQQDKELRAGHFLVNGLFVADINGVEDTGEPELFEHRGEFWHGIHSDISCLVFQ